MRQLTSLEMAICKAFVVAFAVLLGASVSFCYTSFLKEDILGLVISSVATALDLWMAAGCFGLIRNGIADISDH